MNLNYKNESIGVSVIEKITHLAVSENKKNILDEINVYGTSDKDGSATLSFEWIGQGNDFFANEIYDFFCKIKSIIINLNKEAKEHVEPTITNMPDGHRVLYRFRVWPSDGIYESKNIAMRE